MKLGFVILAHDRPEQIRKLCDVLAVDGNRVVIHYDTSAKPADRDAVKALAAENPNHVRVISKVHCVWGEWSLVEAVLQALKEFRSMPEPPDYVHLMSGADIPIRPLADLRAFLEENPDRDFIECCDISQRAWVKGGLGRERFRFYFPFNFRTHRKTFDRLVRWQRKLKIRRKIPLGLQAHMGSQWWTLRWSTCAKVLGFGEEHPKVPRYFRSTWIPDESYFPTVVAKVVPKSEIADLQLLFHHLTPSGRPYVFHNDHLDVLRRLPHFFARKISPQARDIDEWVGTWPGKRRRIPKERHLRRAAYFVRTKIDWNHWFMGRVPGYLPPLVDGEEEPKKLATDRPLLLFLTASEDEIEGLADAVNRHPDFYWQGRPFAPMAIAMPGEALARVGLQEVSWRVRDDFPVDFVDHLLESPPENRIATAAMVLGEDDKMLATLGELHALLPVSAGATAARPHRVSLIAGRLESAYPGLGSRAVHTTLAELPGFLDELAADPLVHAPPVAIGIP